MLTTDDHLTPREVTPPMPDAHGHAALLLVESLIHRLLERSIISVGDAIEIVEAAESVQVDVAEAADGHGAPMWRSHALLSSIAASLRHDGRGGPTPLRMV